MAKKKNWGLIILGIVIFVVIVGAGFIATIGYVMYRQMDIQTVTTDSPEEEFKKARARFEGQVPFIELPAGLDTDEAIVHREQIGKEPVALTGLRVLAWAPRDHKLVRLTLPFWMLRLGGGHRIRLSGREAALSSDVSLNVTAEELERRGPGLILDYVTPRGERLLVWAE
jgi:hypothetical protein